MKVIMLDPIASIPYYDYSLCRALTDDKCSVDFITCHDSINIGIKYEGIEAKLFFFPWANRLKPHDNTRWYYKYYKMLKGGEYLKDIIRLIGYISKQRPAIVHLQWSEIPIVDLLWIKWIKRNNIKIVGTIHNIMPHDAKPHIYWRYKRLYDCFDRIVVHSKFDRSQLISHFNIEHSKIAVIPHGNYDIYLTDGNLTKRQARDRLGLPLDNQILLFFGLIRPYKGLEYLVEAMHILVHRHPKVHLLIAGKKNMPMDAIERSLRTDSLSSRVTFHDYFIPFKDVQYYFKAADISVLPYVNTYNSGVLHLSYSFGLPVIASRTGGIAEVLEHGKSGFLISPSNSNELANVIALAFSDKTRLAQMGAYAKDISDTLYQWQRIAKQTVELYETLR